MNKEVSLTRKIGFGVACVFAIALVVACQQPRPMPPPLEPDPQVTAQIARQKASSEEWKTAAEMTAAQVTELEAAVTKNPEDSEARRKLQIFYWAGDRQHTVVSWNDKVAARRRHILWLIEHHPGEQTTVSWGSISPAIDPVGYVQAKRLWLAATSARDVPPAVLANAARFLDRYAALNEAARKQLTESASQIRAGRMPDFFQYQTTPR